MTSSPLALWRLPLLWPTVGWLLGLALFRAHWLIPESWPWLLLLLLLLPLLTLGWLRPLLLCFALGTLWGLAALWHDGRQLAVEPLWLAGKVHISARVAAVEHYPDHLRLRLGGLRLDEKGRDDGAQYGGQAWLYLYGKQYGKQSKNAPIPGNQIEARVRFRVPNNDLNPGAFDYRSWSFNQKIGLTGYPSGSITLLPGEISWLERMRQRIRATLAPLPDASRGVLLALLLADMAEVPLPISDAFAATGTAHLLAISGLNIGMAAAQGFLLCWWLLTRRASWIVHLPVRRLSLVAGVVVALGYATLAGWPIPTQRSFLMLAAAALAWLLRRRVAPINTLCAAIILITLLDPAAVVSASLWLSFVATLGLLLWAGGEVRDDGHGPQPRWSWRKIVVATLAVTLAATLATTPIIAHLFERLPLYTLPANFVAVPLHSWLIMPLALLTALLAMSGLTTAAFWLATLAAWLVEVGNDFILFVAQLPAASLWIPSPNWWPTLLYAVALIWLLRLWFAGKKRAATLVSLAILALYSLLLWPERPPELPLFVAWDVGQGAASSLLLPDGQVTVVDVPGSGQSRFNGGSKVADGLRYFGLTHVDLLIISHNQRDHSGGSERLLDQINHLGELWLADLPENRSSQWLQRLVRRIEGQGGKVRWLRRGETVQRGRATFRVLWPPAGLASADANAHSLVLSVQVAGAKLLLPGDLDAASEREIVAAGIENHDVLLMSHHGSLTGNSSSWVAAVRPKLVIAQVGRDNRYHFPTAPVVARYQQQGATIRRTDLGAVVVKLPLH